MTLQEFKQFFSDRPAINPRSISPEFGYSQRYIAYILSDERRLTDGVVKKILPVMIKYGYIENNV